MLVWGGLGEREGRHRADVGSGGSGSGKSFYVDGWMATWMATGSGGFLCGRVKETDHNYSTPSILAVTDLKDNIAIRLINRWEEACIPAPDTCQVTTCNF